MVDGKASPGTTPASLGAASPASDVLNSNGRRFWPIGVEPPQKLCAILVHPPTADSTTTAESLAEKQGLEYGDGDGDEGEPWSNHVPSRLPRDSACHIRAASTASAETGAQKTSAHNEPTTITGPSHKKETVRFEAEAMKKPADGIEHSGFYRRLVTVAMHRRRRDKTRIAKDGIDYYSEDDEYFEKGADGGRGKYKQRTGLDRYRFRDPVTQRALEGRGIDGSGERKMATDVPDDDPDFKAFVAGLPASLSAERIREHARKQTATRPRTPPRGRTIETKPWEPGQSPQGRHRSHHHHGPHPPSARRKKKAAHTLPVPGVKRRRRLV